jgi:hypothetical protein
MFKVTERAYLYRRSKSRQLQIAPCVANNCGCFASFEEREPKCPLMTQSGHSVSPLVASAAMLSPTIINRRRNYPDVGDKSDLPTIYRDRHRGGPGKGS